MARTTILHRMADSVRFRSRRVLAVESLEERRVLAGLPFGATAADTGEYMLGSVAVTPVLLESNGQLDPSTEDWTAGQIQDVLDNVREGLQWWVDLLGTKTTAQPLSFTLDTTYADTPVASRYEPISRRSNDFYLWTSDFLNTIGAPRTASLETDMRAFNQAQRVKLGTDWSFTIFVVPSVADSDGQFLSGGSFNRAFSFAGGLFMIVPSTRPASTFAHETGHIFWGRDEYVGGGSYNDQRGYYNTQNTNAANNPASGFVQQPSIMAAGSLLDSAYASLESPASTLAMIGWQDSDGDGIFDVLDVAHKLTGTGYYDNVTGKYRFVGQAAVQTLPNLNPSGLGNDVTINRIREVEVRIDGGAWQSVATPGTAIADLDLSIDVPSSATQVEIRARDSQTTVVSNVFLGRLSRADTGQTTGVNGAVWIDSNGNGLRDAGEFGQAGWTVELVDGSGSPLPLSTIVEPDNLPDGILAAGFNPKLSISSVGTDSDGRVGVFADTGTRTGNKNFQVYSKATQSFTSLWTAKTRRFQANFSAPTSFVQIDVVAPTNNAVGRLEAYNAAGTLLQRVTSRPLASGQIETLSITRSQADIAYIIVGGHANTNVKLDNLHFGPPAVTTTGPQGSYSFSGLATGTYAVRTTPLGNHQALAPQPAQQTVQFVSGSLQRDVDFGFSPVIYLWQNSLEPLDTNGDGLITPNDALQVINEINSRGARSLLDSNIPHQPYVDVNGDNLVTPNDILRIINYLNSNTFSGVGGEGESSVVDRSVDQMYSELNLSSAQTITSPLPPIDLPFSAPASPLKQATDQSNLGAPPIDMLLASLEDEDDWNSLLATY